jgi:Ala-tRNA(Pro) deacylase
MFFVSEISTEAPVTFKSELQKNVYETLNRLRIPFERVDTDEAITMDDCTEIDLKLQMKMVKTLFLCNHQQTDFYLFITCGDKLFNSKNFSHSLGISRVSFAPKEMLYSMLGTCVGAATVLSVLRDSANSVKVVLDEDVLKERWYGCSDGTTTCYLKIETNLVVHDFLDAAGHRPVIIVA